MNAEYQRLEAEASEVQNQIDGLVNSCGQMVAADFQTFEARIAELHQRNRTPAPYTPSSGRK